MHAFFRGLIAAVVLIGLVNCGASLAHLNDSGTFGFPLQPVSLHDRTTVKVGTVQPQSPAAAAGLVDGDTIEYQRTFENRVVIAATAPGDRVTFTKNGRPLTLTAVVDNAPVPWALFSVALLSKLAFLVMAVLIAWRRPRDRAALALSLFLACFGAAINYDFVIFPQIALRFLGFIFVQCGFVTGGAAVLAFACWFPERAVSGVRRFCERLVWPAAAIGYLTTIGSFVANFGYSQDGATKIFSSVYLFNYLAIIAATLVALVASYNAAQREQRARMRWVLGTFIVGFSGLLVLFITLALNLRAPWAQYVALTVLAIPFGLGYVILRHRVIDMGFVVNRAVVYTAVSVVVVGAFIIFEWLLGHVVEENSRASALLELGGALVLGLSVRFIHGRVDRYVDDLFFRDRHVAEAAIRRFAHETAMITDPDVLVRRTVEVTERNARVHGAAFYARMGSKYVALTSSFPDTPGEIDENDPGVLDMRTWHRPIDAGDSSRIPGYAAFPMVVRGQLSGFLACGEKMSHEAFAPDERDALRVLARDAGIALDSLRISRIEQELAYLSADGELPAAIRMRLSSLLRREDGAQPAGAAARFIQ